MRYRGYGDTELINCLARRLIIYRLKYQDATFVFMVNRHVFKTPFKFNAPLMKTGSKG